MNQPSSRSVRTIPSSARLGSRGSSLGRPNLGKSDQATPPWQQLLSLRHGPCVGRSPPGSRADATRLRRQEYGNRPNRDRESEQRKSHAAQVGRDPRSQYKTKDSESCPPS